MGTHTFPSHLPYPPAVKSHVIKQKNQKEDNAKRLQIADATQYKSR